MREFKSMAKRFLGESAVFCLIGSFVLNPANFKVRATDAASLIKTGKGEVRWTETTGEDGKVKYQLTATPSNGYRLKGIKLNGTTIAGTKAAGGTYTFEGERPKTVQKVYFGKNGSNPQAWWIAGYDDRTGGLVLLCDPDTPIKNLTSQVFLASGEYDTSEYMKNRGYSGAWNCTYPKGSIINTVHPNHYGGSDIRAKLKELETDESVFSTAEQGMMKDTTVWAWDKMNNEFYSMTDKLYLGAANAVYDGYITVGANTVEDDKTGNAAVNNGLKVGLNYDNGPTGSPFLDESSWDRDDDLWLRSPNETSKFLGLFVQTDCVNQMPVNFSSRCVPACALDMESVIFASAAEPQSSSTLSEGVYLRIKEPWEGAKIGATATTSGNAITVTKGSECTGDVYLYVQGNDGTNDWVYSKQITQSETISADDDIHTGLTSFDNCRVWLETTDDNVTYAKMVETTAPAEMKSFIDVKDLTTEDTKYGLFEILTPILIVEFEEMQVYSTAEDADYTK